MMVSRIFLALPLGFIGVEGSKVNFNYIIIQILAQEYRILMCCSKQVGSRFGV